jgi:hypothetical protein
MNGYLIVDVDDLIDGLEERNLALDLYDVATSLRNGATLAAGLFGADELVAVAFADWSLNRSIPGSTHANVQQVFVTAGYDLFNVPERAFAADAIMVNYFPEDEPVDELILVTTQRDIANIARRVTLSDSGRVRLWSDEDLEIPGVIYQPLETILGIPTKTVALYVDFENITIGLNDQGYIINLETLIDSMQRQARAHGQVTTMQAYAPWGQRGSLPPLVDSQGREVSDDAPSRLALANIDPVFNLPGKNSADMRIAKDVLAASASPNSAEVFIVASGDRDFNDVFGALRARGKQVVVWGIHGSTSRILEKNPAILLEYVDDFARFQRHTELSEIYDRNVRSDDGEVRVFRPSQWSSVVLQYDILKSLHPRSNITIDDLTDQLVDVHTVTSLARAEELIQQAQSLGLLHIDHDDDVRLDESHPITQKTRLIRDRLVYRVANTLNVRNWEYVNYGFLLKGISMDTRLGPPDMNVDDNWRSEWIDALVREGLLERELVAHRHNPDDLVPVIQLPGDEEVSSVPSPSAPTMVVSERMIEEMMTRVIVSVEQFTSFRGFEWCPLGSLHRRLRPYDPGMSFQQSVEILMEEGSVNIDEYQNPQSSFRTKGISLNTNAPRVEEVLQERDEFVRGLLELYHGNVPITPEAIARETEKEEPWLGIWMSIMRLENVINPVPGHDDLFSLFRTHHTVNMVADKFDFEPES